MAVAAEDDGGEQTVAVMPQDVRTEADEQHQSPSQCQKTVRSRLRSTYTRAIRPIADLHARTPYLRGIPLRALLIILLLILVNLVTWLICALVLVFTRSNLISTGALAYTLGLRHALDADHISAIDLMTRRLIASGQRPVTVGTWFSLGHSTIVIITSIVVAATAAGISKKFDGISNIGSIIGSAVSSAFLLILGAINAYILYKLIQQLRKLIRLPETEASMEGLKIEGSGPLFRLLKVLFKLIDRPWKMYPLGVMFGLGFDTSSEVALLGISSIQGASGTSIWLILILPILFTAGMCLVDTIDGALMLSLYIKPLELAGYEEQTPMLPTHDHEESPPELDDTERGTVQTLPTTTTDTLTPHTPDTPDMSQDQTSNRAKDPLTFLYYSTILTFLTVLVALVIGTIQLLTLIQNAAHAKGPFWDGIINAGNHWEEVGGGICASFVVIGGVGVVVYRPWRRWVNRKRAEIGCEMVEVEGREGETKTCVQQKDTGREAVGGADGEDMIEVIRAVTLLDRKK